MVFDNFIEKIGGTSVVKYGDYKNAEIWVKHEGENPTGSIKDRPALHMIKKISESDGNKNKSLLDASSGSFGCAMAYYGKLLGFKVKVVVSSKLTRSNEKFLNYFGADVVKYGEITKDGYEHCLELVEEDSENYHFLDQLNNWDNPESHYLSTGPEICKQLPNVVAVVASIGSGATFHGISKSMNEQGSKAKFIASVAKPGIKIAGTFLEGKDYFTPFMEEIKANGLIDLEVASSFEEARKNVKELSKKGHFCGIQTGGVFNAAKVAIDELNLEGPVLMISGDSGWKNFEKIM